MASNGISPVSLRRYILRSTSLDVANSVVCHSPLGVGTGGVTAGDSGRVGTGEMAAGVFAGAADSCDGRHA